MTKPVQPITTEYKHDADIEQHGMREHGMLGRGTGMGNAMYAISYDFLPPEAKKTIELIINNGPFPYPKKDNKPFGNKFGDLPTGDYLEFTVPTPGLSTRGMRRIVARKRTGQLFFTACHYERIQVQGETYSDRPRVQVDTTAKLGAEWRNGFYIITGLSLDMRNNIQQSIG